MNYKLLISLLVVLSGCATSSQFSNSDISYFQPPIVTQDVTDRPTSRFSVYNNTIKVGLGPMQASVPSYNGQGKLFASWTPHPAGINNRPTIVFVHGGHGVGPTDFASAVWASKELDANVLVLESYWSRGRTENWKTHTNYGANMRMLDAIAAARWLQQQGVDKDKVFLMGGSQGGWTVLRTFTDDPWIKDQAQKLYRGGIALYPNCNDKGYRDDPKLGPYWGPVLIFTAGNDGATPASRCPSKVFTHALSWINYPDATHAFDAANRGADAQAVDGECTKAANVYNQFRMCRSNSTTHDMQNNVKKFVKNIISNGNNELKAIVK
jgi:dienelactone hydrolase